MPVLLSDEELNELRKLPSFHRSIYVFGIRPYMDYKTGIVGIKRGISYQSLIECAECDATQGRHKTKKISRQTIRRGLELLEKTGVITRQSIVGKDEKKLILKCNFALNDLIRSKYDGAMMALPVGANDGSSKKQENIINKGIKQELKTYDGSDDEKSHIEMMALHPVSGKDSKVVLREQPEILKEIGDYVEVFENAGCDRSNFGNTRAIEMLRVFKKDGVLLEDVKTVLEAEKLKTGGLLNAPTYYQKPIIRAKSDREQILQKSEEVKNESIQSGKNRNTINAKQYQTYQRRETAMERAQRVLDESCARTPTTYQHDDTGHDDS